MSLNRCTRCGEPYFAETAETTCGSCAPATLGDTLAFFAVITACCLGWLLAMWAAWHGLT